jgi:hypothetical protein
MNDSNKSVIERAFELAREGKISTLEDLERTLSREGYHDARAQLSSPALRLQLRTMGAMPTKKGAPRKLQTAGTS